MPVFYMPKEKTKNKRKSRQIQAMRGVSAPEYFLFGLVITGAILCAFLTFEGARQIPTSFPTVDYTRERAALEKKIQKTVKGYPIEKMSPYISQKNKRVAGFLVAIAKKESNWGRHAPRKGEKECFNYWGYRGPENTTDSGYSCFDSPEHAVAVVGGRINEFVSQKIDTPKEMVIWKCGATSCARRDRGAAKWIWDVNSYYKKIYSPPKKG